MGLDMYLNKKTYVQNWDHMTPEERHEVIVKKNGEVRIDIKPERVCYIEEQIGYWRKANAIHKWFVDNVQDGKDECQEAYVCREDLRKLLELVKEVLVDPNKASDLLPAEGGFFFGSTEYDEYYFQDLEDTVKILEEALSESETEGAFYYHSSW